MKTCPCCSCDKNEADFHKNACEKDGLQAICKECKKIAAKKWYARHDIKHRKQVRDLQKRKMLTCQRFVFSYLKTHPCVDCGESDPIVLEFDHRTDKIIEISVMVSRAYGKDAIMDEIEKCDVRCANCHRRKTSKQFNHSRYFLSIEDNAPIS